MDPTEWEGDVWILGGRCGCQDGRCVWAVVGMNGRMDKKGWMDELERTSGREGARMEEKPALAVGRLGGLTGTEAVQFPESCPHDMSTGGSQ